jgi:RNA polymerase sigma-70 factor, ECF subfamily
MQPSERPMLEEQLRGLCARGELARAAGMALEAYGPEIARLMVSVLRDRALAEDAFGAFCERLLKGLPGFRWESTLRTWAYQLARNTCYQMLKSAARREEPADEPVSPEAAHRERSATRPWQRTDVKDRFRALRERLDLDERMLLALRVDRHLSWTEVAELMAEPENRPGGESLERRAAALRQQFQRLKVRLRALAIEEGLIEGEAPQG